MIMKQGQEQQQEDYSKYNIPCFNCQYVHSCKYYSSNLWIDWIFKNKYCPTIYPFNSIYGYSIRQKEDLEKTKDS